MLVTRNKNGGIVNSGDTINDFRDNEWTFVRATRATETGRSGKVIASDDLGEREFYETVFDLTVTNH